MPGEGCTSLNTKPSIVLITESLRRSAGGAEIYMANFSEFAARQGHPVRVLVRRESPDKPAEGVEVEIIPAYGPGLWREKQFAREVRRRVSERDKIVVSTIPLPGSITHYQPHAGLFRAAFESSAVSLDNGFARSLHRLGNRLNLKRQWLMKMQERLFAADSRVQTMTFSRGLREQILSQHPVPPANIVTSPLGVDLTRYRPGLEAASPVKKSSDGNLTLLFVGHNFRLKGLHCLLRALKPALNDGLKAELWIAGNQRDASFQSLANKLGISENVKFLGSLPDADLPALYCVCDALVHPTFSDHCSLVVLEALACGRPVITTRQNGAAELIESGKQGLIVDHPRNLGALTDALLQLQYRERLADMSQAALALRPRLNFANHARATLEWLTASAR